jgi:alanyl-tRNA synthetase
METERLFDQDSFQKEFTAQVLTCEKGEEGYQVVLDRTAFFPEGGGQTADTGLLLPEGIQLLQGVPGQEEKEPDGVVRVFDVQEENGVIYHKTDVPVEPGTKVTGKLHWEERFLKMQHHSGEHIVSGLVNRHFGYNNVGFHLGSQVVTLDFDGVLTKEQLRMIERKANEAVAQNLPIEVSYPSKEELDQLKYRSKIEIEGQVRIITIPGYDVCACCAPHMERTGQIGMIKLVNMQNYKGGVRVYMLCGFAALADYCEKEESVRAIALSLSAHESQVAEGVERLKEEIYKQKGEIARLQGEILDYKVAAVPNGADKAVFFDENLEGNQVRELANKLLEKEVGLAAVFAGNDEKGYRYVIGSHTQDVREISKQMNQELNGRGGGKKEMVQGSIAAAKKEIEHFWQNKKM